MKVLRLACPLLAVLALTGCAVSLPSSVPSLPGPSSIASSISSGVASAVSAGASLVAGSPTAKPTSKPTSKATSPSPATPVAADTLLTEPAAGYQPIYQAITAAKHSVDLVIYELGDTTAEADLVQAKDRGVTVRVILDQAYAKSQNQAAYTYLSGKGVSVHWSSTKVDITHQKTLIVDGTEAFIMTGNLTPQYYSGTRDFIVTDEVPADVSAIEATFSADFAGSAVTPKGATDLVWSPGSETPLVNLINSAKTEILIENEEMNEPYIESALEAAAQRGVTVQVCMTNSSSWSSQFATLTKDGVHIRTYPDSTTALYIHAKVTLVDPGKADAEMFVGSENFSITSLTKNRELGITTTSQALIAQMLPVLTGDFNGASPTS